MKKKNRLQVRNKVTGGVCRGRGAILKVKKKCGMRHTLGRNSP